MRINLIKELYQFWKTCREYNFDFYTWNFTRKLNRIKINDIIKDNGINEIKIAELRYQKGNVGLLELIFINYLTKSYKPKKIFEIGTFDGRTTLNLALNSPVDSIIYTLDISGKQNYDTKFPLDKEDTELIQPNILGRRFQENIEKFSMKNKIKQLIGDSATFDFSPYYNKINMVFIDGAHSYQYVKNDTEVALHLLRDGKGLIVWHDFFRYGVAKALKKFKENMNYNLIHIEKTSLVILKLV
jgi:predicted O-methyltransferase YrrM